ncbi:MAG: TetR/AcrR family transcriptional regulator [Myxococcota bacterium]
MGTEATRTRIIEGAAAVFGAAGIAEATVQDVLERASVSRRTFYQYFTSKEDVLAAVYDGWVDELVQRVGGMAVSGSEPVDVVVAALDTWLQQLQRDAPLSIRMMVEAARHDSQLHARREHTFDVLVSTTDEAMRGFLGARVDPLVYRALFLGAEGLVLHLAERGELERAPARLRRVVGALFFTVLGSHDTLPDPPRGEPAGAGDEAAGAGRSG